MKAPQSFTLLVLPVPGAKFHPSDAALYAHIQTILSGTWTRTKRVCVRDAVPWPCSTILVFRFDPADIRIVTQICDMAKKVGKEDPELENTFEHRCIPIALTDRSGTKFTLTVAVKKQIRGTVQKPVKLAPGETNVSHYVPRFTLLFRMKGVTVAAT